MHVCIFVVTAIVIQLFVTIDGFDYSSHRPYVSMELHDIVVVAYFYVATIIVGTMFPRCFAGLSGPILVHDFIGN